MKLNTYAQLGLMMAIAFAEAATDNSKATPAQKAAAQQLCTDGEAFLQAFSAAE